MIGLIDIDGKLIVFVLCILYIWALAFQHLIGAFKRKLYSANAPMKEGIWAIIWGLGYFFLFALFGSGFFLIFADWGFDRSIITGLFIGILIIAFPLGLLLERYFRLSYRPIYDPDQAAMVVYQQLSPTLQSLLTKDGIRLILDLEFEYQQKIGLVGNVGEEKTKHPIKVDVQDQNIFLVSKLREKGKNFTIEQITEVLKAEEVYLKQIGVLSNRVNQSRTEQKSKQDTLGILTVLLGRGVWRVITISIIIGAILFAKPYITLWFNDILFIKKAISVEKIPFKTALAIVPYYEQLQDNFSSYVKHDNLDSFIQISFSQYYLDQKKFDQALNRIQKTLEKDSEFLPAYTTYGHYFIDQGEIDQAIEKYQLAAQVNEDIPVVNASLCWGYYNKQEIRKAIDYCQKALKIDPKYGLVYGYLVRLYAQNDDYQKAVESYQKANRYGIDKSYVHYYAALAYKELNQLNEAGSSISKSLNKDPKNMDAYVLSSEIRYLQGDKKEAIEKLERVAAHNPTDAKILDYLGTLYENEGRFQEAIQTYKKALGIIDENEEKARVYESLGLVYHNHTKQFDLAEEAFKNALKYDPKQATIYINLGETYRVKGMLKEAVNQQRMALQLDPDNALAHNNLGYYLALQGNISDAIVEFKKALEIDPNLTIAKENLENFQEQ